jgi:hypothetical protein
VASGSGPRKKGLAKNRQALRHFGGLRIHATRFHPSVRLPIARRVRGDVQKKSRKKLL